MKGYPRGFALPHADRVGIVDSRQGHLRYLVAVLVVLVLIVVGVTAANRGNEAGDATSDEIAAPATGPNPPCPGQPYPYSPENLTPEICSDVAELSIRDRNWRLDWVRVASKRSGTGHYHGTARITFLGTTCACSPGWYFEIEILDDDEFVASVGGDRLADVQPGVTVTIKLTPIRRNVTGSYKFPQGPYSYTFDVEKGYHEL